MEFLGCGGGSSHILPRSPCVPAPSNRDGMNHCKMRSTGGKIMRMHRRTLLALAVFTGLTAPSMALAADDTIKIGLLATFEGPFTVLGEDGERGAMTAVAEMNGS